jgi:hypothetical protein
MRLAGLSLVENYNMIDSAYLKFRFLTIIVYHVPQVPFVPNVPF